MSITLKEFETRYVKKDTKKSLASWFQQHKDKAFSAREIVESNETEHDTKDVLKAIDHLLAQKTVICREGYYALNIWGKKSGSSQSLSVEKNVSDVSVNKRAGPIQAMYAKMSENVDTLLRYVKKHNEVKSLTGWVRDVFPAYKNASAIAHHFKKSIESMLPIHGIRYVVKKGIHNNSVLLYNTKTNPVRSKHPIVAPKIVENELKVTGIKSRNRPITNLNTLARYEWMKKNGKNFRKENGSIDPTRMNIAFRKVKDEYTKEYARRAITDPSLRIRKKKARRYGAYHWFIGTRTKSLAREEPNKSLPLKIMFLRVVKEWNENKPRITQEYEEFKKEHPEIFRTQSVVDKSTTREPVVPAISRKKKFSPDAYRRSRIREYVAKGISYESANERATFDLTSLAEKNHIMSRVTSDVQEQPASIKEGMESTQHVLYDCFSGMSNKEGIETCLNNLAYFGSLNENEYMSAYGSNHKWTLFVARVLRYVDRIENAFGIAHGSVRFNNGAFVCDKSVTRSGIPVSSDVS